MTVLSHIPLLFLSMTVLWHVILCDPDVIEVSDHKPLNAQALLNKLGDLTRNFNISFLGGESKIAAIFRGVAYGGPTIPADVTTVTTKITSETRNENNNLELKAYDIYEVSRDVTFTLPHSKLPVTDDPEFRKNTSRFYEDRYVINDTSVYINKTKIEQKNNVMDILGVAWPALTLSIASAFAILIIVAILVIGYLLSGNFYLTKKGIFAILFIILLSVFRIILYTTKCYELELNFPAIMMTLLQNCAPIFLTSSVALSLLDLYSLTNSKLGKVIPFLCFVVVFLHVCGSIFIDIASGMALVQSWYEVARLYMEAITAGWATILCLLSAFVFSQIDSWNSKSRSNSIETEWSIRASKLLLIGGLTQLALAAVAVYSLIGYGDRHASRLMAVWAYWIEHLLVSLLEFVCGLTFLAAIFIKSANTFSSVSENRSGLKWFSKCGFGNKSGVYPAKGLGNLFGFRNNENRTDYVTSDFQLVWNKSRQRQNRKKSENKKKFINFSLSKSFSSKSNLSESKQNEINFDDKRYLTLPTGMRYSNSASTSVGDYDTISNESLQNYQYNHSTISDKQRQSVYITDYKFVGGVTLSNLPKNREESATSICSAVSNNYWNPKLSNQDRNSFMGKSTEDFGQSDKSSLSYKTWRNDTYTASHRF